MSLELERFMLDNDGTSLARKVTPNLVTTGAWPMTITAIPSPRGVFFARPLASCLLCLLLVGLAHAAWAGSPPRTSHLVREGETLYSLARHYGVSLPALMAENGITAPERLAAGIRLRIPRGKAGQGPASRSRDQHKTVTGPLEPDWKSSDEKYGIMGVPQKSASSASGSLLDIPLRHGATLSPEHRDPGAVIMSGAADKKEDFQGHALGVKTRVPAGKDTEVISTLGYGVKATVNENDSAAIGYKTDTSIDGLGYGIGLRHSF